MARPDRKLQAFTASMGSLGAKGSKKWPLNELGEVGGGHKMEKLNWTSTFFPIVKLHK